MLRPCDDPGSADWVLTDLHRLPGRVLALFPGRHGAYARILHPIEHPGTPGVAPQRWETITRRFGLEPITSGTTWDSLAAQLPSENDPDWSGEPPVGTLAASECSSLAGIVEGFTSTSEWTYAVWSGRADLIAPAEAAPVINIRDRPMRLLAGGPSDAATSLGLLRHLSANLWWPKDRSWIVSTDLDDSSTYVGASKDCISAIVDGPGIEAFEMLFDGDDWPSK